MSETKILKFRKPKERRWCLSCGCELRDRRRRYCSAKCRQELEGKLSLSVGLLSALEVRFATFSFTDTTLFLHFLCMHSRHQVFSYTFRRRSPRRPAQDLWIMVEALGRVWHSERRRTGKRYKASIRLLKLAGRDEIDPDALEPQEERRPAVRRQSLRRFNLRVSDLFAPGVRSTLKSAYREEVKKHHPDHGGDAATFRELHKAHRELLEWLKAPKYSTRQGVPGRWSYDSDRGRKWVPPARPARAGWVT